MQAARGVMGEAAAPLAADSTAPATAAASASGRCLSYPACACACACFAAAAPRTLAASAAHKVEADVLSKEASALLRPEDAALDRLVPPPLRSACRAVLLRVLEVELAAD